MTPRQLAAYHEAGHIVLAIVMDLSVIRASVEQHVECGDPECWIGTTEYDGDERSDLALDGPPAFARYVILCAAGVVAEDVAADVAADGTHTDSTGGTDDEIAASRAGYLLAFLVGLGVAREIMSAAPNRAREILTTIGVWAAVETVADALDAKGTLDADAIRDAVAPHGAAIEAAGRFLYRATASPLLGR